MSPWFHVWRALCQWDAKYRRIIIVLAALTGLNLVTWVWTLTAFHARPALIGTAAIAYGLGLRHAMDADHIAAIDNVTRKLMQDGKHPVTVGLYFALGHSTVVLLACVAIAAATSSFASRIAFIRGLGGIVGTSISALFLLLIAGINFIILTKSYRSLTSPAAGTPHPRDPLGHGGHAGVTSRLLRPLFKVITRSWHMYPLGLLFGLGFDTASEIGLLGFSSRQMAHGLSAWSVLIFPVLFTAGMSLVDTSDGILMLGAYGWTIQSPTRKLYYNVAITSISVLTASIIGSVELLGVVVDHIGCNGVWRRAIVGLNGNLGTAGYVIVAVFAALWASAALLQYAKRDSRAARTIE